MQRKDSFADPGFGYGHDNLRFLLESEHIVEAQLTSVGDFAAFTDRMACTAFTSTTVA